MDCQSRTGTRLASIAAQLRPRTRPSAAAAAAEAPEVLDEAVHPAGGVHPLWAELDCAALRHNVELVRGALPSGTSLIASVLGPAARASAPACPCVHLQSHAAPQVKGNAYGFGAVPVCRELARLGVDWLWTGSVEDARRLRAAGVRSRVVMFATGPPARRPPCVQPQPLHAT
jgi:hypothetical protein